jgi:hypothetical protein
MQNVITKIKTIVKTYNPNIITSLGVRIRNPFDEKGYWVGWSTEEIAEHFSAVNKFKETKPKEKEPNGRGC